MNHSHRTTLMPEDINMALRLKNHEVTVLPCFSTSMHRVLLVLSHSARESWTYLDDVVLIFSRCMAILRLNPLRNI